MHEPVPTEGGRPQGQLERSLMRLAVGTHFAQRDRHNALNSTKMGEYDQQVEVQFSGTATDTWGFADIAVSWEHPFVYAPLQRDPPFERPHVTSHIEITEDSGQLVIATAHVVEWLQTDESWFIGARVRVAASAPGQQTAIGYAGVLHLTFQGFATPTDEEDQ